MADRNGRDAPGRRRASWYTNGHLQDDAQFAAVILAGGRARRLAGADKPGLTVGGRTLIAAVADAAVLAGARRVIVVGPRRPGLARELTAATMLRLGVQGASSGGSRPAAAIVRFTCEHPPGSGPVSALRAGIALVSEPRLAVLAADLPFLRDWHLKALLDATVSPIAGAVLTDDGGRRQWLASCWHTTHLRAALAGYQGSSLHGVLEPLHPVDVVLSAPVGQPPHWLDCDTPEDLAAAKDWASPSRDEVSELSATHPGRPPAWPSHTRRIPSLDGV